MLDKIVTAVYDSCRSNPSCGLIPSFPDFAPILAQMNESSSHTADDSGYQVTALTPTGLLVVKEQFFQQFENSEEFQQIIGDHNEKFNADGARLTTEVASGPAVDGDRVENCVLVEPSEPLTAEKLATINAHQPQAQLHDSKMAS